MKDSRSVRGSAIIFLFIAIALFAALAYAFMQGSRNSLTIMTDEQAKAEAQKILEYANTATAEYKRASLGKRCSMFCEEIFEDQGGAVKSLNGTMAKSLGGNDDVGKYVGTDGTEARIMIGDSPSIFNGKTILFVGIDDQALCNRVNFELHKINSSTSSHPTVAMMVSNNERLEINCGEGSTDCSDRKMACGPLVETSGGNPVNFPYAFYSVLD